MPTLSYSRGPDAPLLEKTIHEVLSEMAGRLPDQLALVVRHQNARLTYRQLQQRVEEVARGLSGLGLKPGDRIGVWASGCVEWVLLYLACARTGIVQVNVNPAYRSQDLGFVLRKSKIKALFLHSHDARADYGRILGEAIRGKDLPLQHAVYLGGESWDAMLTNGVDVPPTKITPHDIFNIQYTSGTTGFPKGVLLTQHNVLNNALAVATLDEFYGNRPALRLLPALSLCRLCPGNSCKPRKRSHAHSRIGAI